MSIVISAKSLELHHIVLLYYHENVVIYNTNDSFNHIMLGRYLKKNGKKHLYFLNIKHKGYSCSKLVPGPFMKLIKKQCNVIFLFLTDDVDDV